MTVSFNQFFSNKFFIKGWSLPFYNLIEIKNFKEKNNVFLLLCFLHDFNKIYRKKETEMKKNEFIKKVINDPGIFNPEEVIDFFELRGDDYDNHMIHIKLMKQLATSDKLSAHKMQTKYKQYKLLAEEERINVIKIKEFEELFNAVNFFKIEPNWAAKGLYFRWKDEYERITYILSDILHLSFLKRKDLVYTIFNGRDSVLARAEEFTCSKYISVPKREAMKALTEAVRLIMKMQNPLEILCSLVTANSRGNYILKDNDVPIEVRFGKKCLLSYVDKYQKGIAVVLPSPIFVLIVSRMKLLKDIPVTFVVSESERRIYEEHFGNAKFCGSLRNAYKFVTVENYIAQIRNNKAVQDRRVLVMTLEKEAMCLLEQLNEYAEEDMRIVILGTDSYITEIVKNYKSLRVEKVVVLPTGIPNVARPKQKVIISMISNTEYNDYDVDIFRAVAVSVDPYLIAVSNNAKVRKEELLMAPIRPIYEKTIKGKTKQRQKSSVLNLTNEIAVRYSYSHYEKAYQVDAKAMIVKKDEKGIVYEKSIENSRKRKVNIGIDDITAWINNVYPYSKVRRGKETEDVRSIISGYYLEEYNYDNETMTLKTAWYITPEIEDLLNAEEVNLLSSMMMGPLGEMYLSEATFETIMEVIEHINESDKTSELIRRLNILNVLFGCLCANGICEENIIKDEIIRPRTRNKRMQQIRDAFGRSYFRKDKYLLLHQRIIEKIQLGEKEYLATLIKLYTGLSDSHVVALTWDDYISINTYGIKALNVSKQYNRAAMEFVDIDEIHKIRQIPISSDLEVTLEHHLAKIKELYPNDYGKQQIVKPLNYGEKNVTVRQIAEMSKELIDYLDLEKNYINVPSINDTEREYDIFKYFGDLFQSNFFAYCDRYGGMTEEEINYLSGRKQHTALARNYLDFGSDGAQLILYRKIKRIEDEIFNSKKNQMIRILMDVDSAFREEIKISNTFGFNVNILRKGSE